MTAPESIWLTPHCADAEVCWCEHQPDDCDECGEKSVAYIRADLVPDPAAIREAALKEAARIIQKRIGAILQEEGSWEPDTNVTNLPECAERVIEELENILALVEKEPKA